MFFQILQYIREPDGEHNIYVNDNKDVDAAFIHISDIQCLAPF